MHVAAVVGRRRRYRVAVVGGSGMWGRWYMHCLASHPDVELIALVDRSGQRAREYATHFGCRLFEDVAELFASDLGLPDIVATALPTVATLPVVLACAAAGVPVVGAEKPLAVALSDADAMVDACAKAGVAFACGTAHFESPFLAELAAWISSGQLGRLMSVSMPGGLSGEVSGTGCVALTIMRLVTGREVEWVEGCAAPSHEVYTELLPPDTDPIEVDSPAYGRLGLTGGVICDVPESGRPAASDTVPCRVVLACANGTAFVGAGTEGVTIVRGSGADATLVRPIFLSEHETALSGEGWPAGTLSAAKDPHAGFRGRILSGYSAE